MAKKYVLVRLEEEADLLLEKIKKREGLSSKSQAVVYLHGREIALNKELKTLLKQ